MVVPHHPHHIQKNHRWYHSWQSHDNWSARRPKHHGTTTTCGMVGHNRIVVVVVAVIVRVLFIVSILLLLMVLVVASQQLLFMTSSTTTTTSFDSVLLLLPIRLTPTTTTATISQQQSRVDRIHVNNHEEEEDDNHESRLEFYHSLMEYLRQQQQQPVPSQSSSKHYSSSSNNNRISKTKWMTHFIQQQQQQQQQRSNSSTSKSGRNSKYSDANDPITPLWKNDDHDTTISFTSNSMVDLLPYCNMTAILIHNTAHHSHIRSTNTTIRTTTTQQWLDRHSPFIVPSNRINVTQYVHTLLQQIQHPLLPHVVSPQRLQQLRTAIQYEIWLQLLEQYMSMKYSMYCNYTDYFHDISHRLQPQPSLPTTSTATNPLAFHPSETTTHHTHSDANTLDIAIPENQSLTSSSSSSRHIVYIISAYKDIVHLQSLLEAIGMYRPTERDNNHSQHFRTTIIIHIDLFTSTEYQQQIQGMIASQCHPTTTSPDSSLCHIHMIQSDIVIYRTDSISMVNYKILYYITIIIKYQYDYVVLCDGLSYPLVSPEEFRQILSTNRQVYLGQLLHNGRAVEQPKEQQSSLFIHRLYSKRLIYAAQIRMTNSDTTTTTIPIKLHLRLPRSLYQVPSTFQQQQIDPIYYKYNAHMKYKSTSGNQGIYSYNVVSRLVTSAKVQELFALSKYSCCCCMEEHNWIAALHLIDIESKREDRNGYGIDGVDTTSDNANNSHGIFYDAYIRPTSMFQLWGGMSSKCQGTMSNAFLASNGDATSLCYRSEDPYHSLYTTYRDRSNSSGSIGFNYSSTAAVLLGYDETKSNYFLGDELWNVLMHSKHHRQAIMARKFTSITNDTESYRQLIQMIQAKLWMK